MSKSEKLYISRYNDFYGCLLTEHQCEMIKLYYDYDISLFEIAEQFGVSRQAVRDSIKRAEQLLEMYELKLGLVKRYNEIYSKLVQVENAIVNDNMQFALKCIGDLKEVVEDNNGDI